METASAPAAPAARLPRDAVLGQPWKQQLVAIWPENRDVVHGNVLVLELSQRRTCGRKSWNYHGSSAQKLRLEEAPRLQG